MRIAICALVALAVVVGLTGCTSEDVRQADARTAVQASVAAKGHYTGVVRCTGNPKPWFVEEETSVFICLARRDDHGCDWFRATLQNAGWSVALDRPNGGCVLPF